MGVQSTDMACLSVSKALERPMQYLGKINGTSTARNQSCSDMIPFFALDRSHDAVARQRRRMVEGV